MNSATHDDENRKLILALRTDLEVLRATQTATNAVVHALLATHAEPHHAKTAIDHVEQQLKHQTQNLQPEVRDIMARAIESMRTTLDRNQKNRDEHKARAAH